MSAEVQSQFYLFFLAVFWGIGMCLAYDGLRILRNLIRHSLFWINAEDLLYWAVMTAVLFYLLFTYNRGEIRSLFYLKTISPVYISLLSRALSPFFRLFRKIRQILRKFRQNSGDRY